MINPFKDVNWSPTKGEIRSFGKSLVIGGIILTCLLSAIMALTGTTAVTILRNAFAIVAVVGIPAWIAPGNWAKPIYVVWYAFGSSIGIVVANLTLALFYYAFFSVIALVMRLGGRDALCRKSPPEFSNWHDAPASPERRRYTRQY
jgi:hypothetical protein